MKLCICRLLLSIAIIVIALIWWPATWAKIVIVIAAALLAIMSLFYNKCCLHKVKEPSAISSPSEPPKEEIAQE